MCILNMKHRKYHDNDEQYLCIKIPVCVFQCDGGVKIRGVVRASKDDFTTVVTVGIKVNRKCWDREDEGKIPADMVSLISCSIFDKYTLLAFCSILNYGAL